VPRKNGTAVHNTNLRASFSFPARVMPSMIRRGAGDIINISSLAGKNTFANGGIYCASKWGVNRSFRLYGRRSPRSRNSRQP